MSKKMKHYMVSFHVLCEQSIEILAYSKKEAKEKAKIMDGEPNDFNVLYNLWSTANVLELEEYKNELQGK